MSIEIGDFSGHPLRRGKKFLLRAQWFHYCSLLMLSYAVWIILVHFLSLTFITYFLSIPHSRLQDINDSLSSNQVSLMGLASLIFTVLLWRLHPITSVERGDIFKRERFENSFVPGFLKGATYSGALILFFILVGAYRYLGYFIQFSAVPLDVVNVIFRMLALAVLAYTEEFLFRFKVVSYFKDQIPSWLSAQLIAFLYCGIKLLQFDLSFMHLLTLYLLSLVLFYRSEETGTFERGAGYWAGCLIVLQPLASLPIFGNEFSGTLMIKTNSQLTFTGLKVFTGGEGGPLASLAFQALLLLDLLRSILTRRQTQILSEQKHFLELPDTK